ncbi:MAG: hypothetical protein AAGI54_08205 [Planctomycetota bacterium]
MTHAVITFDPKRFIGQSYLLADQTAAKACANREKARNPNRRVWVVPADETAQFFPHDEGANDD